MFKKIVILAGLIALAIAPVYALNFDEMDSQSISLKAGPTEVTEDLSIAWVEAALYPKNISQGQEVFLEVKLTSRVSEVTAYLDSDRTPQPLFSDNQKDWSRVIRVPENLKGGAHLVRVVIKGAAGRSIQRSLEFVMRDSLAMAQLEGVPLKVLNSAIVTENGDMVRQLLPGVTVYALGQAPFYRVKLSDGKEGWVEGSKLSDPTEELYLMGLKAYKEKDYTRAIVELKKTLEYRAQHIPARLLLAQSYLKIDEVVSARGELRVAQEIAPTDPEVKAFTDSLPGAAKQAPVVVVKKAKPAAPAVAAVAVASAVLVTDSVEIVKNGKTSKGTSVSSALASVLSLTKSLGTKIFEDGWQVKSAADGLRVVFACRQERSGKVEAENFEWKLDPDTRRVTPLNDNARLLMSRW